MAAWDFLPNPGREREGLGNAGIETFKGSPYPGIARECSQNSLDAAARAADGTHLPVHLIFRLLRLQASDIPGLSTLRQTLGTCLDQARLKNQKKEIDFFARAVNVAGQEHVRVLCIEDYGTTGLGPSIEGSAFDALVKSTGVTEKPDPDAGGSFGIGKSAAFAVSSLRTVFYSTRHLSGGGVENLAQGKSVLVSHEELGEPKRATGYWGEASYTPVEGLEDVPEWLRRTEIGTTVASIGFLDEPDWNWQMVESLIRNFFSAINRGDIRFTVRWSEDEFVEINAETLPAMFTRAEVQKAAEGVGTTEDLAFSAALLETLNSPETQIREAEFKDVGKFKITLLQKEGFPRRMAVQRNGMYIVDNLKHFGHPMARFPLSREFAAILEPSDRATSGRVRDMEGPKHDELSAERIDDLQYKSRLKAAMKRVGSWVRDTIKAATTTPTEGAILLQEMNRFFAKTSPGPTMPDPSNLDTDPERQILLPQPTNPRPPAGSGEAGASGSSGGTKKGGPKSGRTSGDRLGKGRGAIGGRGGEVLSFRNYETLLSPLAAAPFEG